MSADVNPVPPAADLYAGQGGSYVIDPATGQRDLVERTAAHIPSYAAESTAASPDAVQTSAQSASDVAPVSDLQSADSQGPATSSKKRQ